MLKQWMTHSSPDRRRTRRFGQKALRVLKMNKYREATLSKLENSVVVDDRSASADEGKVEQSQTIEEQTILEAPRGK